MDRISSKMCNPFEWEVDGERLNKVLMKFETYCNTRKNVVYETNAFNTQHVKSIDQYVTQLIILVAQHESRIVQVHNVTL